MNQLLTHTAQIVLGTNAAKPNVTAETVGRPGTPTLTSFRFPFDVCCQRCTSHAVLSAASPSPQPKATPVAFLHNTSSEPVTALIIPVLETYTQFPTCVEATHKDKGHRGIKHGPSTRRLLDIKCLNAPSDRKAKAELDSIYDPAFGWSGFTRFKMLSK